MPAVGHNQPITVLTVRTFKGLLDSETRRMVNTCSSAKSDIEPRDKLGRQCAGYLSLSRASRWTSVSDTCEFTLRPFADVSTLIGHYGNRLEACPIDSGSAGPPRSIF
jgi:hypothetical protein